MSPAQFSEVVGPLLLKEAASVVTELGRASDRLEAANRRKSPDAMEIRNAVEAVRYLTQKDNKLARAMEHLRAITPKETST